MYSNWFEVENLDFNICDLENFNFRLKKLHRRFKERYEYGLELTERLMKRLEIDYKNSVDVFSFTSHVECVTTVLQLK